MKYTLVITLCCAAPAVAADRGPDTRPNILFAISDDQSYPHASAYGCKWIHTPGFDAVAKSGVLFHSAFAPTPGCSPTRAAILTGRHAWQLQEAGTHASSFPANLPVFTETLAGAGYFTGHTGKGWGPGNWKISGRSQNPAGPNFSRRKTKPPHRGISSNDYAANFIDFLDARPPGAPFCFWFGGGEPHRAFEAIDRPDPEKLAAVEVPRYLPDVPEVRADLLAYGREIEWFDAHLSRMLNTLRDRGELDNTIVIVTSDNGMAFPRAKANLYEDGVHMPLAIAWPNRVPGGRTSRDLVSLIDLAPTILDAAGIRSSVRQDMTGRSLHSLLLSEQSGVIEPARTAVFCARERHSSSRYRSLGYPQRAVRTNRFLYIRNDRPERWPAGAPQKYGRGGYPKPDDVINRRLGPMHAAYQDIDACPTLSLLVSRRDEPEFARCLGLAVNHRPAEELFDITADPGCLNNLADHQDVAGLRDRLSAVLTAEQQRTGDPRASENGDVFETYPRFSSIRVFPEPDWTANFPERVPSQPWLDKRLKALTDAAKKAPNERK